MEGLHLRAAVLEMISRRLQQSTRYSLSSASFLYGESAFGSVSAVTSGSNFNCTLGVKVTQGINPNQVRNMYAWLLIDNQRVNPGTNNYFTGTSSSPGANDWRRIGGAGVANAQDMHTVVSAMQPNIGGVYNRGTTFAIDDLQCFPTGQCAM